MINLNDPFLSLKLEISEQKYEEHAYIYIQLRDNQISYSKIETPNTKEDLSEYYSVGFHYRNNEQDKVPLPFF